MMFSRAFSRATPRGWLCTLCCTLGAVLQLAAAPVLAEPVAAAPEVTAPDTPLGRLFYTPERRAALERQRQYNIMEARALEGATLSLDGVVTRSSGKSTVWVNGQPSTEKDVAQSGVRAQVRPGNPGSAVLLTGDDQPTALKVGEVINRGTGDRNDRLGGGAVVANGRK